MTRILVVLLLFASPFAHADDASELSVISDTFAKCKENAVTTSDRNSCADVAYAAAKAQLNKIYGKIVASLQPSRQANDAEIFKRINRSQRTWSNYCEAQCQFIGSAMLGSSSEGPLIGDCLVSMTLQRARVLLGNP